MENIRTYFNYLHRSKREVWLWSHHFDERRTACKIAKRFLCFFSIVLKLLKKWPRNILDDIFIYFEWSFWLKSRKFLYKISLLDIFKENKSKDMIYSSEKDCCGDEMKMFVEAIRVNFAKLIYSFNRNHSLSTLQIVFALSVIWLEFVA